MHYLSIVKKFGFLLLALIITVILIPVAATLLPPVKGYDVTIIRGDSMNPTYISGQLAITQQQPDYSVGDVVKFTPPGAQRAWFHRIAKEETPCEYLTIGDRQRSASLDLDVQLYDIQPITCENIIGKSVYVSPSFWGAVAVFDVGILIQMMGIALIALCGGIVWLLHAVLSLRTHPFSSENTP